MDKPGHCWSWACGESMLEHMCIAGYGVGVGVGVETAPYSHANKPETGNETW